jgi:hypothetical protein
MRIIKQTDANEGAGAGCQYVVHVYKCERKEATQHIIDDHKLLGYGAESHGPKLAKTTLQNCGRAGL